MFHGFKLVFRHGRAKAKRVFALYVPAIHVFVLQEG
jgi:hypothetical protein